MRPPTFLAALSILLLAACGDKAKDGATSTAAKSSPPAAVSTPAPAKTSAQPVPTGPLSDEWKDADVGGVLSIELPGSPETKTDAKKVTTVSAKPSGGYPQISITVAPAGPGLIKSKSVFDAGRDTMVKAMKAKVDNDKDIKLDKYDGREFILQSAAPGGGSLTSRVRMYVIGQNIVTIAALFPEGKVEPATLDAFYDSAKAK